MNYCKHLHIDKHRETVLYRIFSIEQRSHEPSNKTLTSTKCHYSGMVYTLPGYDAALSWRFWEQSAVSLELQPTTGSNELPHTLLWCFRKFWQVMIGLIRFRPCLHENLQHSIELCHSDHYIWPLSLIALIHWSNKMNSNPTYDDRWSKRLNTSTLLFLHNINSRANSLTEDFFNLNIFKFEDQLQRIFRRWFR